MYQQKIWFKDSFNLIRSAVTHSAIWAVFDCKWIYCSMTKIIFFIKPLFSYLLSCIPIHQELELCFTLPQSLSNIAEFYEKSHEIVFSSFKDVTPFFIFTVAKKFFCSFFEI